MQFHLVADYKKLGFSKGLVSLWSGKLILEFALNLFGLFLPIFLYQELGGIDGVIIWFIVISLGYFLVLPGSASFMNRIGLKASLIIGVAARIPYFYALYKLPEDPVFYAALSAASLVVVRSFFWLPFQTDSAKFSNKKNRGKQFGMIFAASSVLAIAAPIAGGFILDRFDFAVLSVISLIICVMSAIPLLFVPQIKEEISWSYMETIKYFFHPFNRRMVIAYMSDGAVGTVNGVFWPLFIFSIMNENFSDLGMLTGGILLVGVVLRLVVGNLLDKFKKTKMVRVGILLNSTAWIVKTLVVSAMQVFLSSIYHTLATIVLRTSLDTLVYEKAADRGHYIDEYTLIKEMAIHIGKVITLVAVVLLLMIFPIQAAFILAAIVSLFISLLR